MARLRREATVTHGRLTDGQARTIERLRRDADQLGDAFLAAQCERALAGQAEALETCLDAALELLGQLI